MRAFISDIHGNAEALEAVLRDIAAQGVDEIWCLGDIVGYGPQPGECIDLVRKNCSLSLMGNHDWAVVHTPVGFNAIATRMVYRTKEWMQITEESTDEDCERWDYLCGLALKRTEGPMFLVHASPRAELTEYILPTDVLYDRNKLLEIMAIIERYCFVGHTHMPCCITEDLQLVRPEDVGGRLELDERKDVVNIGSVGQPRDGDNRACYVTVEQGLVTYHRVPYRYEKTAEKLKALGREYEILAQRLAIGM